MAMVYGVRFFLYENVVKLLREKLIERTVIECRKSGIEKKRCDEGKAAAILENITTGAKNKTNNNHKIFRVVLSEFPGIFHLDPRVISLGSPFAPRTAGAH